MNTEDKAVEESTLVVGGNDKHGDTVKTIYHTVKGKYTIYETSGGEVRAEFESGFGPKPNAQISLLLTEIASLTSDNKSLISRLNSRRAFALKVWLDDDANVCIKTLQSLKVSIVNELTRRAKLAYIVGSGTITLPCVLIFFAAKHFLEMSDATTTIFAMAVYAALGAFVSVALEANKARISLIETFNVNFLYGLLRVVVGTVCGVIVYSLIKAQIILAFLDNATMPNGFFIAAFLAGFSERFVPSALTKLENEALKDSNEK